MLENSIYVTTYVLNGTICSKAFLNKIIYYDVLPSLVYMKIQFIQDIVFQLDIIIMMIVNFFIIAIFSITLDANSRSREIFYFLKTILLNKGPLTAIWTLQRLKLKSLKNNQQKLDIEELISTTTTFTART